MPSFDDVEVTATTTVDFEVFCGTCGEGLCSESSTRKSRSRGYLQVEVNTCPSCIERKDEEIEALKQQIEELTSQVEELNEKLL